MKCTNCGAEFEGRFCPSCGTAVLEQEKTILKNDISVTEQEPAGFKKSRYPIAFCVFTGFDLFLLYKSVWFIIWGEGVPIWFFGIIGILANSSALDFSLFFNILISILQLTTLAVGAIQIQAIYALLINSPKETVCTIRAIAGNVALTLVGVVITFLIDIIYDGIASSLIVYSIIPILFLAIAFAQYKLIGCKKEELLCVVNDAKNHIVESVQKNIRSDDPASSVSKE